MAMLDPSMFNPQSFAGQGQQIPPWLLAAISQSQGGGQIAPDLAPGLSQLGLLSQGNGQFPAMPMAGPQGPQGGPLNDVSAARAPMPQPPGWLPSAAAPVGMMAPGGPPSGMPGPNPVTPQQPSLLNRIGQGVSDNSNLLMALGSGIMQGGIGKGLQMGMQGSQLDQAKRNQNLTVNALVKRGLDIETAKAVAANPAMMQAVLPTMFKAQVRPLSPEQKQALGLPAGLPWFAGPDGKPMLPEGIAQGKLELTKDASGNPVAVNPYSGVGAPIGGLGAPQAKFEDVSSLRKEFQGTQQYKTYNEAAPIYQSMVETAGRNTRASDLNLVYGLAKIFDPTSVVREGEMIAVKNTASLPDWVIGNIQALNGGAALLPETRKAVLAEAQTRMQAYRNQLDPLLERYGDIARTNNMRVEHVLGTFPQVQPWTPAPKAAEVQRVKSFEEALKLPKGTRFIDPNGVERIR